MDLSAHGITSPGPVHANLATPVLVEMALQRREGILASNGALVAYTGAFTGRAARDKFVVRRPESEKHIWWGKVNGPLAPESFERILADVAQHYVDRELFVFDGWAGADPKYRVAVRVITTRAWQALFTDRLLIRPAPGELAGFRPELVIHHAPDLELEPARHGTRTGVGVILDFDTGRVAIAGTHYAGEIKKSVFTYLNYRLPERGVFPMHCSANLGPGGDSALLFGLSGTGKTTLSADPGRRLIGDDEHGWSPAGVFNFEGGCYAKCIHLSEAREPQIWDALRFGCILENVVLREPGRVPDYDDSSITENTRAAYPLDFIPNYEPSGRGGHPRHLLFLACDAFGVLPPLSKLTPAQAQYHFLLGYTAKVAGTEAGVGQPEATFSTCFASPFLPRAPTTYARMLDGRLREHVAQVWLVNTGWTGGGIGQGRRFPLPITRRLVHAALSGELDNASFATDPFFNLHVPTSCPGVPSEMLQPRTTWSSAADYERQARHLAQLFQKNFAPYAADVSEEVRQAGPRGGM